MLIARLRCVLILLAMFGGCTPGDGEGSDGELTYDTMPRLALTPGTILCPEADSDGCQFVDISLVATGPDGRVALAGASGEAVQFDSAGRFVRRIGRQGSGPGEYRSVMAMTYDTASTLTLFDVRTQRLVRFDSAGQPARTSPVQLPPGTQDASFVGGRLVFAVLPGAAAIGDTVETQFVAVDSTGAPTIVMGRAPAHALATGDGSMMPFTAPFAPRPRWGISRGGALHFAQGTALRVLRADGAAPRVVVDMPTAPSPVTAAELDSARALMLRAPRSPMPTGMAQALRQQLETAAASAATVHPMIGILVTLDDGTIWTRETVAAAPDSIRWNAFGPDGQPLGYLLLPVTSRIIGGDRGRLFVVAHDENGVPRVERPGVTVQGS